MSTDNGISSNSELNSKALGIKGQAEGGCIAEMMKAVSANCQEVFIF